MSHYKIEPQRENSYNFFEGGHDPSGYATVSSIFCGVVNVFVDRDQISHLHSSKRIGQSLK